MPAEWVTLPKPIVQSWLCPQWLAVNKTSSLKFPFIYLFILLRGYKPHFYEVISALQSISSASSGAVLRTALNQ